MGITIHYSAIASNIDELSRLISGVGLVATTAGYRIHKVDEECVLYIIPICGERVSEETKKYLEGEWLEVIYAPREKWKEYIGPYGFIDEWRGCWGYWSFEFKSRYEEMSPEGKNMIGDTIPSRIKGAIVDNPTSETFNFVWYKAGDYWVLDSFTKTQPFSLDEVKSNVRFHVFICSVLKYIEARKDHLGIIKLNIHDEGGYYETGDVKQLIQNFDVNYQMIEAITKILRGMGFDARMGERR